MRKEKFSNMPKPKKSGMGNMGRMPKEKSMMPKAPKMGGVHPVAGLIAKAGSMNGY